MKCPECFQKMLHQEIEKGTWAWCCLDCEIHFKDRWKNETEREE